MASAGGKNPGSGGTNSTTGGTKPGSGGTKPATGATKPTTSADATIAIKVAFELNTPDGMRRVNFGLEKDFTGTDVIWKIHFELWERTDKTKDFGDAMVTLDVQVNPTLNARAEQASNGLTPAQTAHATGPAADAAKAFHAKQLPKEVAQDQIQGTVAR